MFVRIWKKNGGTDTMKINTADEMAQIKVLAEKFGWEIDIIGKRPWWVQNFSKKVEKVLDNRLNLCYNKYRKREGEITMMEWYMNPELHDEDFAELAELLEEGEEE